MSTIFKEIPRGITRFFKPYKNHFTKPQYPHFKTLVTGLIVNDKKTIQEVNDALSYKNQSSLNRFVTSSRWDINEISRIRLREAVRTIPPKKEGFILVDKQTTHKIGKKMEKAAYHRSGKTKRKEWGHCIVDTLYTDLEGNKFPIDGMIYVNRHNCDKETPFKTKRELALEQIDFARKNKVIANTILADSEFYSEDFVKELKIRRLKHILGVKISMKVSIDRKKRIAIREYVDTLTDDDFDWYVINDEVYFLHTKEVSVRGVGREKLLISYKQGDEETIKIYVTDHPDWSNEKLMNSLVKRWDVECLHRDTKQHLGLEKYQVRKYRGIQVVVLAILAAYTLLVLSQRKLKVFSYIKQFFGRRLRTIGELCRFMQLAAQKGWRWITTRFRDPVIARGLLNKYVLVKNAKV